MNKETLKALKGSIAKWKNIVGGVGVDQGTHNCPLCEIFADGNFCTGCPVAGKSKSPDCLGTPYVKWALLGGKRANPPFDEAQKKAARAELRFLQSLLPKRKPR